MAKIIPVATFDCVVFGATGDLTLRKLLPALYYRFRDGQIPPDARIIAAARSDLGDEDYRERATKALQEHVASEDLDTEVANRFCARLCYARLDATDPNGDWDALAHLLDAERVRVFYLATSPELYGPICRNIGAHELVTKHSRVVLEKPIGHDLASAREINDQVGAVFTEPQIFRIDHYLGKETVQNLLALRFANTIFERLVEHRRDRPRADHGGRDGRRGAARRLLRRRRRAARHGAEPHAATAVPDRDGAAAVARRRSGARREAEGAARAASDRAARGCRR